MSEHIKTFEELGEYYNNLCSVEGVDPALIGRFERMKLVNLDWLRTQLLDVKKNLFSKSFLLPQGQVIDYNDALTIIEDLQNHLVEG